MWLKPDRPLWFLPPRYAGCPVICNNVPSLGITTALQYGCVNLSNGMLHRRYGELVTYFIRLKVINGKSLWIGKELVVKYFKKILYDSLRERGEC
jgi:hypothetical protein